MERIVNINLQSRVIPFEESAYDSLRQYIDTLRRHFANEEGCDEIINDIENRIAELLNYKIKQGAPCITTADLNVVIDGIGRVEDMVADDTEQQQEQKQGQHSEPERPGGNQQPHRSSQRSDRFYRNEDDKVIAGVCSGLAARINVDPIVVRLGFVVLIGALFWIYVLLWIIVPSRSLTTNITRKLYRNADDNVIAGVCGGLAAYFRTSTWVPRLIFVLPFLVSVASTGFQIFWWHWPHFIGPRIFTGGLGSTFFILYIILWVAVPYANSTTSRMEMRGERIDLDSIRAASQAESSFQRPPARYSSGIGRVIAILFKAFFMFIGGVVALSFFGALIGVTIGGMAAMPFTQFLFDNQVEHLLSWVAIALILGMPFLSLFVWIVRRMMGVRSGHHYPRFCIRKRQSDLMAV